jgi:hypothetical protein
MLETKTVLIVFYVLAIFMVYIPYGYAVVNYDNKEVSNVEMQVLFGLSLVAFFLSMIVMWFSPIAGSILLVVSLICDYIISNVFISAYSKNTGDFDLGLWWNSYIPYIFKLMLVFVSFYYYGQNSEIKFQDQKQKIIDKIRNKRDTGSINSIAKRFNLDPADVANTLQNVKVKATNEVVQEEDVEGTDPDLIGKAVEAAAKGGPVPGAHIE